MNDASIRKAFFFIGLSGSMEGVGFRIKLPLLYLTAQISIALVRYSLPTTVADPGTSSWAGDRDSLSLQILRAPMGSSLGKQR